MKPRTPSPPPLLDHTARQALIRAPLHYFTDRRIPGKSWGGSQAVKELVHRTPGAQDVDNANPRLQED